MHFNTCYLYGGILPLRSNIPALCVRLWTPTIFICIFNVFQVSLFCLAIGQDPKDLPIAIVNAENDGASCNFNTTTRECPISFDGAFGLPEPNEHLANFTCRYLSFLDSNIAHPVYFDNLTSALQSVEDGDTWGVVSMDGNFSVNLYKRLFESIGNTDLTTVNLELLEKSSIKIRMDVTNQHIALTLQMKFVEAFQTFMKQLVRFFKGPLEFEPA